MNPSNEYSREFLDTVEADAPNSIQLVLTGSKPEVVSELMRYQEGPERDEFAVGALTLGVLSLRFTSGQIDATALKGAGEQLLAQVRELLSSRSHELTLQLTTALTRYFDPQTGL